MAQVRQLVLPLQLQEQSLFTNFIGGANRLLVDQLQQFARRPTEALLYIYGPSGAGKTHLLTASCHLANQAGVRAVYLDLARFVGGSLAVLEGLDQFDLLVLDSLEALTAANTRASAIEQQLWQQALYELMYAVRTAGGRFLVASTEGPQGLKIALPDLRTRLSWGPCWSVKPLTDSDRAEFLKQRANQQGMQLDDESIRWLLNREGRDTATLLLLLQRLAEKTLELGKKPSLGFIKTQLKADAEPLESPQSP